MKESTASDRPAGGTPAWRQAVAGYQGADRWHSLWQLANTLVPYCILWVLMALSLRVSYWLTLALAVLAAAFLMRIFIFFHDAGHGSFFHSRAANDAVGILTGVLTFTPYYAWRHSHARHHATAGDLDRRGEGDVWTMTLQEYPGSPAWKRVAYRIVRFPLMTFVLGPPLMFLVVARFPGRTGGRREKASALFTDLALLGVAAAISWAIGLKAYLMIQLPVLAMASIAGVWMFYVQHQFENTYWERHASWDFATSAMQGASCYRLPRLLNWFSGNIGYHHIHHLSPRIPNYKLKRCFEQNPVLQQARMLTFRSSLRSARLHLWDEETHRLVGFGALKSLPAAA